MKLEMHPNSLFAILLRSPWWISLVIGFALVFGSAFVLPREYAFFVGLPFFVIGVVAGWKQLRAPSDSRVADMLAKVREMAWTDFVGALEQAFQRQGYSVKRLERGGADLELVKDGRVSLVACKRWKAARAGVEPLRELVAAKRAAEARDCVYVSAGEISEQARRFAAENNVRLVEGAELARLASPR